MIIMTDDIYRGNIDVLAGRSWGACRQIGMGCKDMALPTCQAGRLVRCLNETLIRVSVAC